MDKIESGIYLEDSLKAMELFPKESVRLILADPPYTISRPNNFHTMGRTGFNFEWDQEFDQTSWLDVACPLLVKGGSLVVFNDWKNLGDIEKHLTKIGMLVKKPLIFTKSNPIPRNRDRSFVQSTEFAIWAVKPGEKWIFNRRSGKAYETGEFRYPIQKGKHPTKKPDKLFQDIVSILTNENDLVMDPFAGEGTTAYACTLLNRQHVSYENNPEYHKDALAHWDKAKKLVQRSLA